MKRLLFCFFIILLSCMSFSMNDKKLLDILRIDWDSYIELNYLSDEFRVKLFEFLYEVETNNLQIFSEKMKQRWGLEILEDDEKYQLKMLFFHSMLTVFEIENKEQFYQDWLSSRNVFGEDKFFENIKKQYDRYKEGKSFKRFSEIEIDININNSNFEPDVQLILPNKKNAFRKENDDEKLNLLKQHSSLYCKKYPAGFSLFESLNPGEFPKQCPSSTSPTIYPSFESYQRAKGVLAGKMMPDEGRSILDNYSFNDIHSYKEAAYFLEVLSLLIVGKYKQEELSLEWCMKMFKEYFTPNQFSWLWSFVGLAQELPGNRSSVSNLTARTNKENKMDIKRLLRIRKRKARRRLLLSAPSDSVFIHEVLAEAMKLRLKYSIPLQLKYVDTSQIDWMIEDIKSIECEEAYKEKWIRELIALFYLKKPESIFTKEEVSNEAVVLYCTSVQEAKYLEARLSMEELDRLLGCLTPEKKENWVQFFSDIFWEKVDALRLSDRMDQLELPKNTNELTNLSYHVKNIDNLLQKYKKTRHLVSILDEVDLKNLKKLKNKIQEKLEKKLGKKAVSVSTEPEPDEMKQESGTEKEHKESIENILKWIENR